MVQSSAAIRGLRRTHRAHGEQWDVKDGLAQRSRPKAIRAVYLRAIVLRNAARALFFGNYFYGACAAGLAVEATLQQRLPLLPLPVYLAIALVTVVFYTQAYRRDGPPALTDARARWYEKHRRLVSFTQVLWTLLALACAGRYYVSEHPLVLPARWAVVLVFPLVGAAYYGPGMANLRRIGWLKPFVIGFVWAGTVTVLPAVLAASIHPGLPFTTRLGVLLFVKNLMFVGLLAVLFDIKDTRADHRARLRTWIVQRGLRGTLFRFVLPLVLLGLATFLTYATTHSFSAGKILLNTLPFLLLVAVAFALRRRRRLWFYLVVVDGLLLVKALCGIVAMRYF